MRQSLIRVLSVFSQLRNSFYAVIVLIQILLVTLSVLFANLTIRLLDQNREVVITNTINNIRNAIASGTEIPKVAVLAVAENKLVTAAFAQRDRQLLLNETLPLFSQLKQIGFKQFQFNILTANKFNVFLRVHQPEKFGDDLAHRPMIAKSALKKEVLGGLEQGKSGYGFRVVAPVEYQGRYVGSFEMGYDFGEPFLKQLNTDYPGSWAIYNLDRGEQSVDDRILLANIGQDRDGEFQNIPLAEDVMKKIRFGEIYRELSRQFNTSTLYVPVRNFQGDIALVLKYVAPTDYFTQIRSTITTAISICLIGLLLSGFIIYVLHNLISTPVRKLVFETEKIRNFQLDDEINFTSSLKEISELIESTRRMKLGLQSFQKYVPAQLVRQLINTNQEASVGGQRRNMTVFFSDVENFTTISESLTPNELTAQLSEYLSLVTDIIIQHQGTVDKYIGDAVMAFWGAPLDVKNHAELACKAALACHKKCQELNARWAKEGKYVFNTRVGINSGEIIVGNIGSSQRLSYTIIGDEVNLASRLEGLNKTYGTNILVSQNTVTQLPNDFALRALDFVIVKGKTKPVTIYELVAEKGDIRSVDLEFLQNFNESVALYKSRNWDGAIDLLTELQAIKPLDKATILLLERCRKYRTEPPHPKWKGEFSHNEK